MIKGPNRIWSINSYNKLSRFGFQIYSIIDIYSRRILDFFVNLSNRIQIIMGKFYLYIVKEYSVPKAIQIDKGKETKIFGVIQFAFR